jgi:hypothetical protein
MTYVLRFLPEVEEDAITAFAWYQEKAAVFLAQTYTLGKPTLQTDMVA